mgnify:FL=1|jgi:hypothetical protein
MNINQYLMSLADEIRSYYSDMSERLDVMDRKIDDEFGTIKVYLQELEARLNKNKE